MSKKILLLNSTYEVLHFTNERNAIKLIFKGKVEVISVWAGSKIFFNNGFMEYPAIIRMKYHIRRRFKKLIFSKKAVFKRDSYTCQYCLKQLSPGQVTLDHIIPVSLGGVNSFLNCVAACFPCNGKKGNKTLEQVGMQLATTPYVPANYLYYIPEEMWHPDWNNFVKK